MQGSCSKLLVELSDVRPALRKRERDRNRYWQTVLAHVACILL